MLQTERGSALSKPDGGYVQISTLVLGLLWWAHTTGRLSLRAVRVGLALFELRIRRAAYLWTEKRRGNSVPDFTPRYSTKELGDYCGLPEKRAKAALAELQSLGLVTEFTEARIAFASSLEALALSPDERAEFRAWLATLTSAGASRCRAASSPWPVSPPPRRSSPLSSGYACAAPGLDLVRASLSPAALPAPGSHVASGFLFAPSSKQKSTL